MEGKKTTTEADHLENKKEDIEKAPTQFFL